MATTWNPVDSSPNIGTNIGTFSPDLLSYSYDSPIDGFFAIIHGNLAISTGRYQFEYLITNTAEPTAGNPNIGIARPGDPVAPLSFANFVGVTPNAWGLFSSGNVWNNNNPVAPSIATFGIGDIIGVLVDATVGTLWFTKNGISSNGVPGNSGGWTIATGVQWLPAASFLGQQSAPNTPDAGTANFAGPFAFPVTGFAPWTIPPPLGSPKLQPYWYS